MIIYYIEREADFVLVERENTQKNEFMNHLCVCVCICAISSAAMILFKHFMKKLNAKENFHYLCVFCSVFRFVHIECCLFECQRGWLKKIKREH